MKRLFAALALIIFAAAAYAASELPRDGGNNIMQYPAFNGAKTTSLTAAMPSKVNIDLRQDVFYSVYCASASKERTMFGDYTTAMKATYVQSTIPATTWHTQAVNKTTPFLNLSGCVGQLRRQ